MLCDVNFLWLGPTSTNLKVLTNGKRCGLKVLSFDMSRLKLFTLRFSNKSVRAPSCDVWIHHVANKFPRFFHTPPPLYRYWESTSNYCFFSNNRNRIRWAVLGLSQDEESIPVDFYLLTSILKFLWCFFAVFCESKLMPFIKKPIYQSLRIRDVYPGFWVRIFPSGIRVKEFKHFKPNCF